MHQRQIIRPTFIENEGSHRKKGGSIDLTKIIPHEGSTSKEIQENRQNRPFEERGREKRCRQATPLRLCPTLERGT